MNQDIHLPKSNLLDLRQKPKEQLTNKKKKPSHKIMWIILAVLLLIIPAIFFISKIQKKEDPNLLIDIKNKVSKHIVLPNDEDPALATITDINKISTPFLKQAENGDKMLVYQNAKKVILYRPSIDRIIDVGPVSIAEPNTN